MEPLNWPSFVAGFITCVVVQWLWAALFFNDWLLRVFRKNHIADLIRWVLLTALVFGCFVVAVLALSDYLKLLAWSIRAGVY